MAKNNKLKAYVRFDGSGRIIPGSLILNRFKPAVGNWKETPSQECCSSTPPSDNCVRMTVVADEDNLNFLVRISAIEEGLIATINWGDGTTESVSIVTLEGEEYSETIYHEYSSPGTYQASVCANFPELVTRIVININD